MRSGRQRQKLRLASIRPTPGRQQLRFLLVRMTPASRRLALWPTRTRPGWPRLRWASRQTPAGWPRLRLAPFRTLARSPTRRGNPLRPGPLSASLRQRSRVLLARRASEGFSPPPLAGASCSFRAQEEFGTGRTFKGVRSRTRARRRSAGRSAPGCCRGDTRRAAVVRRANG